MATRAETMEALGLSVDIVSPLLEQCYKNEEKQIWENDLFSSPHGKHWHTSNHASQFPGDPEDACPRKAVYGLMNFASNKPTERAGRAIMEAGLDIEDRVVTRFQRAGILLSNPPDAEHQTNFQEKKVWLSGNSDAIIKIPRSNRPYVVELKTKFQNKIDMMKAGEIGPDKQHINQIKTYIALVHNYGHEYWPDMDECIAGSILYISRDKPSDTVEFKFKYDPEWWEEGIARLEEWNNYFIQDIIPPKPENFMWSKGPCQYCPMKKEICKPDFTNKIENLSESHGIEWTKKVRGDYNYKETRQAVLNRWKVEDEPVRN